MYTQNKELDFKGQSIFIGIDVHLKNWTVTIRMKDLHLKTFSMDPSPELLYRHLIQHYPGADYRNVYEAGFCGFWVHRELEKRGINGIVANPLDIPSTNKEKRRKGDRVDSSKLSRELANGDLIGIYVPDIFHEQLRSFCRLYSREVEHLRRIKCRIRSHLHSYGIEIPIRSELSPWTARFIAWLETVEFSHAPGKAYLSECIEELKEAKIRIHRIVKTLRDYSREEPIRRIVRDYLMSVPGVGFITAILFYSEIIDMKRFGDFDHLAAYVGFIPDVEGSGDREVTLGLTRRQNRYLRYLLIEAAWVAVRKDPAMTQKFGELTKRMSKQMAIVRIAKKLLSRMRRVWLNEKHYSFGLVG